MIDSLTEILNKLKAEAESVSEDETPMKHLNVNMSIAHITLAIDHVEQYEKEKHE